jgi:hypothetical protein
MVGHLYDRRPRAKASLDREAMAKVVCVGISVFDYVFRVERLPEAHIKYYALGRLEVSAASPRTRRGRWPGWVARRCW